MNQKLCGKLENFRHRSHRVELQFQCYPCMSMGAFAEKALGATAEVVVARLAHSYQPPEGHRLSLYPISFALISRTRKITKMLSTIDSKQTGTNLLRYFISFVSPLLVFCISFFHFQIFSLPKIKLPNEFESAKISNKNFANLYFLTF